MLFHCDNKAVVDIWENDPTKAPQTMALVRLLQLTIISMYVLCAYLVYVMILLTPSLAFRWTDSGG